MAMTGRPKIMLQKRSEQVFRLPPSNGKTELQKDLVTLTKTGWRLYSEQRRAMIDEPIETARRPMEIFPVGGPVELQFKKILMAFLWFQPYWVKSKPKNTNIFIGNSTVGDIG